MTIKITLDSVMKERGISSNELAQNINVSNVNISLLKTGKVKGVRFDTLELICKSLNCQPGDIIKYVND